MKTEKKKIAGRLHVKIQCTACRGWTWTAHGQKVRRYSYVCLTCQNGGELIGEGRDFDPAQTADIRYHGK